MLPVTYNYRDPSPITTEKWSDPSPITTYPLTTCHLYLPVPGRRLGILLFFDHVLAFVGGLGLGDEAARGGERAD